jgi:hypothetical protein
LAAVFFAGVAVFFADVDAVVFVAGAFLAVVLLVDDVDAADLAGAFLAVVFFAAVFFAAPDAAAFLAGVRRSAVVAELARLARAGA